MARSDALTGLPIACCCRKRWKRHLPASFAAKDQVHWMDSTVQVVDDARPPPSATIACGRDKASTRCRSPTTPFRGWAATNSPIIQVVEMPPPMRAISLARVIDTLGQGLRLKLPHQVRDRGEHWHRPLRGRWARARQTSWSTRIWRFYRAPQERSHVTFRFLRSRDGRTHAGPPQAQNSTCARRLFAAVRSLLLPALDSVSRATGSPASRPCCADIIPIVA